MTKAVALLLAAFGAAAGQSAPRFDLPRMPVLTDQVVPIAISGLTPGHSLTITLRGLRRARGPHAHGAQVRL